MCACHPWGYYTVFCMLLYVIIAIKMFHLNMTVVKLHGHLVSVLFGPDIENFLMTKYDTVNILQCLHEKLHDREGIYDP